jgi:hypothetical protein
MSATSSAKWSEGYGDGSGYQGGHAIAADPGGEIVVAASFAGTIDFGGGPLVSAVPEEMFDTDVALVKLTADGAHVWSKAFGAGGKQRATDVAVDAAGNIVIAGTFDTTLDFGAGPLSGGPGFIAKLDPSGSLLWAKGISTDNAIYAALDGAGSIFVAVGCKAGDDFGGGPLAVAGLTDACVIKLDPDGAHVWSRALGGPSYDFPTDVAIGPAGEVVVVGGFKESIDLAGSIKSAGDFDAFVARLDDGGAPLWGRGYGGPGTDEATGVVWSADGPIVTGHFIGDVNFGGGGIGGIGHAGFVVGLNDGGKHRFSTSFRGLFTKPDGSERWSLALNPSGGFVLGGQFAGELRVGKLFVMETGGKEAGDLGLIGFNADGSPAWVYGDGDHYSELVGGIAVAPSGEILVTGEYYGAPNFGNGELPGMGYGDLFIAAFPADL